MHDDATTTDGTRTRDATRRPPDVGLTVAWHPVPDRIGRVAFLSVPVGGTVDLSRHQPTFEDGAPLADRRASRSPLQLVFRPGGGVQVWPGRSDLAFQVDGQPGRPGQELPPERLRVGVALGLGRGPIVVIEVGPRTASRPRHGLVGSSAALERVRCEIDRVGGHGDPVLVLGESGTGKELVARAVHDSGARADRPFVAVNMAAIPASTAASQLFGHSRGAFTGADGASSGYFGEAEGGTLFLDEIGACPPELQVQLLRALDRGEVQPVGGRVRKADVRVVAATDENLDRAVAEGRFKAPLLYRLAQEEIRIPPLRERPADIGPQLVHFLRLQLERRDAGHQLASAGGEGPTWLGREVLERALAHPWPGNTRELSALAGRLASRNALDPACVWTESRVFLAPPDPTPAPPESLDLPAALERFGYRLNPTARALGIAPNTLRRRMDEQGLPRPATLTADQIRDTLAQAGDFEQAARELRVSAGGLRHRASLLGIALRSG